MLDSFLVEYMSYTVGLIRLNIRQSAARIDCVLAADVMDLCCMEVSLCTVVRQK